MLYRVIKRLNLYLYGEHVQVHYDHDRQTDIQLSEQYPRAVQNMKLLAVTS